ncbi:ribose-phosphate pyrophosphokinase-like domain-containing protein, partial [Candidatus Woesearchaeota archaeon]|nr:ribose-phosphate pyrophosphokinase-like domain-containing protein [Candidatus Woesearchaeota archaeon]
MVGPFTIVSTRSGMKLARLIAKSLSEMTSQRLHQLAEQGRKSFGEWLKIQDTRSLGDKLFGHPDCSVRYVEISNFANGEIKVRFPDYVLGEGDTDNLEGIIPIEKGKPVPDIVSNSFRGQDVYLVFGGYEPIEDMDDIKANIRKSSAYKKLRQKNPKSAEEVKALVTALSNHYEEKMQQIRLERSINDNIMEALIVGNAVGQWAGRITLICPEMSYARQDHIREREPYTAQMYANQLAAIPMVRSGFFFELHSSQLGGFFPFPINNLRAIDVLLPGVMDEIKRIDPEGKRKITISTADVSGAKLARSWESALKEKYRGSKKIAIAIFDKKRDYETKNTVNESECVAGAENIQDSILLTVDDMVDTAGSYERMVDAADEYKPFAKLLALAHPYLTGPAISRLDNP